MSIENLQDIKLLFKHLSSWSRSDLVKYIIKLLPEKTRNLIIENIKKNLETRIPAGNIFFSGSEDNASIQVLIKPCECKGKFKKPIGSICFKNEMY